jgi:glucose/arabinose dehydrogenase
VTSRLWPLALVLFACRGDPSHGDENPQSSDDGEATDDASSDDGPAGPFALQFQEIEVEGGLAFATELKFLPTAPGADAELLVLGKEGDVSHLRVQGDGAVRLGTFTVPGVYSTSDCGLISLAIDPEFADNGFIYVGICESQTESTILRLAFTPADYAAIGASAVEIMRVGEPLADRPWHNVGAMGFDDTGAMWALFGDKRRPENGQDLDDDLGAVVRILPSHAPEGGHAPAPDNPFLGMDGIDPDVWAYGLRSPWRGTLDAAGRLWIGDVGANDVEEVNVVARAGENFGWSDHEGPCVDACTGVRDPVVAWPHDEVTQYMLDDADVVNTNGAVAWVGIEHRPGASDPYGGELAGKVLFGDFCLGYVRALAIDDDGVAVADTHVGHLAHASAWDQGPDGFLYVTTFGSCETGKLDPADPPPSRLLRAIPSGES